MENNKLNNWSTHKLDIKDNVPFSKALIKCQKSAHKYIYGCLSIEERKNYHLELVEQEWSTFKGSITNQMIKKALKEATKKNMEFLVNKGALKSTRFTQEYLSN